MEQIKTRINSRLHIMNVRYPIAAVIHDKRKIRLVQGKYVKRLESKSECMISNELVLN